MRWVQTSPPCQLPLGRCIGLPHGSDVMVTVDGNQAYACHEGMVKLSYWALLDWLLGPEWRDHGAQVQITIDPVAEVVRPDPVKELLRRYGAAASYRK